MEPQAGRQISPFRTAKRSNDFLNKNTRRSRVHVQTIGLNAETKKCRHRADGEKCLLTFPFIGQSGFANYFSSSMGHEAWSSPKAISRNPAAGSTSTGRPPCHSATPSRKFFCPFKSI